VNLNNSKGYVLFSPAITMGFAKLVKILIRVLMIVESRALLTSLLMEAHVMFAI
jgi:hypothetical protein